MLASDGSAVARGSSLSCRESPWPPGHRWGHWRRVRFDDGETHDVDTDVGPAYFHASGERVAERGAPSPVGRAAKRQKQAPRTAAPFMQLLR